jgi:hypothetical protein
MQEWLEVLYSMFFLWNTPILTHSVTSLLSHQAPLVEKSYHSSSPILQQICYENENDAEVGVLSPSILYW